ncbi:LpqB family beta-propeller domain-containing protein [Sphingosinicella rhizophila]|uniref:LpqB family beta-propeller domain-containing protein n=1 Tax=Sphingosinicella rhizophila TaxID=3050082 RepID=A0ABU3QB50_9SPHN|nr:LpqB family beta-propeller domain-containing protein [Sphingosinicella sp. GR2756]MDT9600633.1 LpqB family beta-propeller domain-containing protein [Sphingosinicella sp. GR2756]
MPSSRARSLSLIVALLASGPAQGQWTSRYPEVENAARNVGHQLYLEAYNLPTFAASPTDPAPSPDGRSVAFAARGWLWTMDIATRQARRLTRAAGIDSRPAWSPDGRRVAFVRDSGRDTRIMLIQVGAGKEGGSKERVLVDGPALELDPVFAPDGKSVFYASAEAGDFDLWQVDLASGARTRLTDFAGQELNPQPIKSGTALAFVDRSKFFSDAVSTVSLADGKRQMLRTEGMAPQLRIAASPDGRSVAIAAPDQDRLRLIAIDADGGDTLRIAPEAVYPLAPSWSRAGDLWFVQPTRDKQFALFRVPATGGAIEEMTPLGWDLGEGTARVTVRTRQGGAMVPARLAIVDGQGHPAVPATGLAYFDSQHGKIFVHSPGIVTLDVPAGTIRLAGTHGFDGVGEASRRVRAGEVVVIDLELPATGFDAAGRGWLSGDLHNHLNYGGPYQLEPDDLTVMMRAEALDVATPQLANLQTREVDGRYWGWRRTSLPLIQMSQEVRSHYLGHIGVIGADALFDPWFFGPTYPVRTQIDLANHEVLRFARAQGGLNVYVHPVTGRDPFPANGPPGSFPIGLVPDAVMGDVDAIELACLWSDELGTSQLWYRLLNLGLPIVPTAGSDTMQNIHRMAAIGADRVYAKVDGPASMTNFVDALRQGRSFVTTGPMIDFAVAGAAPGGVIAGGARSVEWKLDLFAPTAVETVEILVNGRVAWSGQGLKEAGKRHYTGTIDVPAGGWIAARVHGGAAAWPTQDAMPFAHSAPVWLGRIGSVEPGAARAAADDLLRWMNVADEKLARGYPDGSGVRIKARFADARKRLEEMRGR